MQTLWQDMRYGLRMLRKNPGFTIVAVVTLALGIGANTAIFSVLNAVIIRPLPYREPGRLVMMWESDPQRGLQKAALREGAFPIFERESKTFEAIGEFTPSRRPDTIWGTSEPIVRAGCTASIFRALGVRAILGRTFLPSEETSSPRRQHFAVLSYRLWQQHFKGSPDVIGKTLTLTEGAVGYVIVGVMPEDFSFPYPLFRDRPDLWFALPHLPPGGAWSVNGEWVVGRLKPGVKLSTAQSEVQTIAGRIASQYPNFYAGEQVRLVPLSEEVVSEVSTILLVFFGAVSFLFLIACANVGNMLLSRGMYRGKEMAIRMTFGASRLALVRQMLVESTMLGIVGGAAGILLAVWIVKGFVALIPPNLYVPRLNEVTVGGSVLAYTFVVSVVAAVTFGLLPALRLSRPEIGTTLKSGVAVTRESSSLFHRPGSLMLVTELALAIILVTGGLLLTRSLQRLLSVDLSFQPQHLLTMIFEVSNSAPDITAEQRANLENQFLDRAARLPGVKSVALTERFPMSGRVWSFKAEGGVGPISQSFIPVQTEFVTAGLFDLMGMELKKGRLFAPTDRPGTAPVVVINDVTARRYWPNSNPLGTRMQEASVMQGEKPVYVTVIGIVRQSRNFGAGEEAVATVYLSESQMSGNLWATIVARSIGDPRSVVGILRETAEAIVPGETKVSAVRTGDEIVAQYAAPLKFETTQLDTFAVIALLLAAVGVYGLISYFISQRTHEIGLRLALGAQRHELLRMVIAQAMELVLAGAAIGLCGALALRRAVRSLLFDVSSTDPATFAGVVVLLVVVALLACWIPARRATRVDPMVALRYE